MGIACALLVFGIALPCVGSDSRILQPLGPSFWGCGCSLRIEPEIDGAQARQLLFQDMDDSKTTHVRIDGRNVVLQSTSGELFVEWGSPVGTPVRAGFAAPGHVVEFEGKVVRTCYEHESCEAVWYEGVLKVDGAGVRERTGVAGACGC